MRATARTQECLNLEILRFFESKFKQGFSSLRRQFQGRPFPHYVAIHIHACRLFSAPLRDRQQRAKALWLHWPVGLGAAVKSRSTHGQTVAHWRSNHGQPVGEPRSTHGQPTASTRSTCASETMHAASQAGILTSVMPPLGIPGILTSVMPPLGIPFGGSFLLLMEFHRGHMIIFRLLESPLVEAPAPLLCGMLQRASRG